MGDVASFVLWVSEQQQQQEDDDDDKCRGEESREEGEEGLQWCGQYMMPLRLLAEERIRFILLNVEPTMPDSSLHLPQKLRPHHHRTPHLLN